MTVSIFFQNTEGALFIRHTGFTWFGCRAIHFGLLALHLHQFWWEVEGASANLSVANFGQAIRNWCIVEVARVQKKKKKKKDLCLV